LAQSTPVLNYGRPYMELIPILATVSVVTIIMTIVFVVVFYAASRSRDNRAPKVPPNASVPEFFKRYHLPR
jgi:uncharacterized membrane protein